MNTPVSTSRSVLSPALIRLGIALALYGWANAYVTIATNNALAGESGMQGSADTSNLAPMAHKLRVMALEISAIDAGITSAELPKEVWGLVTDIQYPEGLVTVVALADGTASIYAGPGSGVIGGHAHEAVRIAAKAAVAAAVEPSSAFRPSVGHEAPLSGSVRFFVHRGTDLRVSEFVSEETLGEGEHSLSPLFYAVQAVIAQLRETSGD